MIVYFLRAGMEFASIRDDLLRSGTICFDQFPFFIMASEVCHLSPRKYKYKYKYKDKYKYKYKYKYVRQSTPTNTLLQF